mmetsp:Transcript_52561/g.120762  ORF Transcript_52561/g.120762 Transcript_52561/m.120762 type:complete len:325 (-) Transcript_52561:1126-2100(-)
MMRMICRVSASWRKSSPHLNMTVRLRPCGSAFLKTSHSGTFFESMHLHFSTMSPEHSNLGSSGSWNLGGNWTALSSSLSSATRSDLGTVLTRLAALMSSCSTVDWSISCSRCGPQQRMYSSINSPKRSHTSGRCISALSDQKNWWPTWCGHASARRSSMRASAELCLASYLSTCVSCSTKSESSASESPSSLLTAYARISSSANLASSSSSASVGLSGAHWCSRLCILATWLRSSHEWHCRNFGSAAGEERMKCLNCQMSRLSSAESGESGSPSMMRLSRTTFSGPGEAPSSVCSSDERCAALGIATGRWYESYCTKSTGGSAP